MQYYGTRLSENISKREPEGYLLCLNVPVARTGTQEYLPEELGLAPGSVSLPSGLVPVFRPEAEVFAPETVASFEGMPVTNDHPPDGVDIENIRRLQMGHAHNVRRGTGEESDLLLADLIITDPRLIDAILAGKREISCGYIYELCEENGQYLQRKIRGNHIAVVDAGRAGSRVSIKDHRTPERRKTLMKKSLSKLLARMAKDGDVEAVAELIEEMIGEEEPAVETVVVAPAAPVPETPPPAEEPVSVEVPENHSITIDEESISGIIERLDRLIALLAPAAPAGDEDPLEDLPEEIAEVVEEALEAVGAEETAPETAEEVAGLVEEMLDPVVSTTIGETEEETDNGCSADPEKAEDALRFALKAIRPALAEMPARKRKKVCAGIASNFYGRKAKDAGVYAALLKKPKSVSADYKDLGMKIMQARNPHYKQ